MIEKTSDLNPGKRRTPIWENTPLITVITALIAGSFTLGKFIQERYRYETETDIASKQRQHEIRLKYLGIALQPENTLKQSDRVLRFLKRVDDDPILQYWAKSELDSVENNKRIIDSLYQKIAYQEEAISKVSQEKDKTVSEKTRRISALKNQIFSLERRISSLNLNKSNPAKVSPKTPVEDGYFDARIEDCKDGTFDAHNESVLELSDLKSTGYTSIKNLCSDLSIQSQAPLTSNAEYFIHWWIVPAFNKNAKSEQFGNSLICTCVKK